jgi:hypothetical protein
LSGFTFTCATLFQEGFQEGRGLSARADSFALRTLNSRDYGPLFTARNGRTVWVPNPRPVAQIPRCPSIRPSRQSISRSSSLSVGDSDTGSSRSSLAARSWNERRCLPFSTQPRRVKSRTVRPDDFEYPESTQRCSAPSRAPVWAPFPRLCAQTVPRPRFRAYQSGSDFHRLRRGAHSL